MIAGRPRLGRARVLLGSTALAALAVLSGCASFGGNVKGSFSCAAPDGICAPSSSIDDRALAMIAGESGGGDASPAGPYQVRPRMKASRTAAPGQRLPVSQVDAHRTQERVLRIVFHPYIDERGRLHEASAVHAVVQSGEWQQKALAFAAPIPDRNAVADASPPESLAEAVDRADPIISQATAIDPNLPNPAVVAAARARRVDPVQTIQNDVAARLAPKAGRTPVRRSTAFSKGEAEGKIDGPAERSVGKPAVGAKAPAPNAQPTSPPEALPKTTSSSEAAARLKASPEYQAREAQTEGAARQAGQTGAVPDGGPKVREAVRVVGFPASVPEEN